MKSDIQTKWEIIADKLAKALSAQACVSNHHVQIKDKALIEYREMKKEK